MSKPKLLDEDYRKLVEENERLKELCRIRGNHVGELQDEVARLKGTGSQQFETIERMQREAAALREKLERVEEAAKPVFLATSGTPVQADAAYILCKVRAALEDGK